MQNLTLVFLSFHIFLGNNSFTQERKKNLKKRKYLIGKLKKINKNNITRNELIEVRESTRYTVDNFAIKSNERNFF